MRQILEGQVISGSTSPSSILFPASYGPGLVFCVLIRFLVGLNNDIINAFISAKNVTTTKVNYDEIINDTMLVAVENKVKIDHSLICIS